MKGEPGNPGLPGFSGPKGPAVSRDFASFYVNVITGLLYYVQNDVQSDVRP